VYGEEEVSTINHGRLAMARRIAAKLVVSEAMEGDGFVGNLPLATAAQQGDRQLFLDLHSWLTPSTHERADRVMASLLEGAYREVRELLSRNRAALEALEGALMEEGTLSGDRVAGIVRDRAADGAAALEGGALL